MNVQALANELNVLLYSETRSLVRHLDEARPYLTPKNYRLWKQIEVMIHQSQDHASRINELLDGIRAVPKPVSFRSELSNLHFLTLDSLLPLIIEEKQRQLAAYQRAIEHAGTAAESADLREELGILFTEVRAKLDELEAMQRDLPANSPVAGRH